VKKNTRKKKYGLFDQVLARLTGETLRKHKPYGGSGKMNFENDVAGEDTVTGPKKSISDVSRLKIAKEDKEAKTVEDKVKPQLITIKSMARSLERQQTFERFKTENQVYTFSALLAVHYMTFELANKLLLVVLATSAGEAEISAGLMLPIYSVNAFLVYYIQPWRRGITVSFRCIRVRNVMNKADTMNFVGQGLVLLIALVLKEGITKGLATIIILALIGILTAFRLFVVVSMVAEKVKQKLNKSEASFNEDPVGARKAVADRLYEISTSAALAEVGLFVFKFETDVNRRRAAGRLEECKEYLLSRADRCKPRHARNKRALLLLSKTVIERIELLQPPPPPKEDMNKLLDEAEQPASQAAALVEKNSENILQTPETRIMHQSIVMLQKSISRCENLARIYADCELINELNSVSCNIKRISYDSAQLSLRFGYFEGAKYEKNIQGITNKDAVPSMRREDFDGFLGALKKIDEISAVFDRELMELIQMVEDNVINTDRSLADACIESLTRNFVNSKVNATKTLRNNWNSWIPYMERENFAHAVHETRKKEKLHAAAIKENDLFGAKRVEKVLDDDLNAYVKSLETKIELLKDFETSFIGQGVKDKTIEIFTEKVNVALDPRRGIRAQGKPGWTDAVGDFFGAAFVSSGGENEGAEEFPGPQREKDYVSEQV
jgi:hypothetical protein